MRSFPSVHHLSVRVLWLSVWIALVAIGTPVSSAISLTSQEQALASSLTGSSGQNRPFLRLDPTLTQVARSRAADMARRGYFAHVNPDGDGPNQLIREAGYPLPEWWGSDRKTNYVESIAAGRSAASATWSDFMNSAAHKRHLLAESDFYQEQTSYGIGHVSVPGSQYGDYWVILTAPPRPAPALRITSPGNNTRLTASQVSVTGTAAGDTPPQAIQVRVENSAGTSAYKTANGTTAWNIVATDLAPGVNTIRARSLDASGNVLAQTTCDVRYVVLAPLTVSVAGNGTVTSEYLGQSQREVGIRYTVTAKPAADSLFAGWSGGVNSAKAALTFTMREGLQLTASFVPNPFLTRSGTYGGAVTAQSAPSMATSGLVRVSVTSQGVFTGNLTLGGATYSLVGRFETDGTANVTIRRRNQDALVVSLQLDLSGTGGLSATISDGVLTAGAVAQRAYRSKSGTYPHAGRYTLSLPPNPANTGMEVPQGNGYATLLVSSSGRVRILAKLADGASFSRAGTASEGGSFPIFASLYSGRGFAAGELRFAATEASDLEGTMAWSKKARSKDRFYPTGFATTVPIVGSRYTVPTKGNPVVDVTPGTGNGALSLGEGDLVETVVQPLTIEPNNRVRIEPPTVAGLSVTISPASGVFTGTFKHPMSGETRPIRGVIFQKQNAGYGFFLGINQSGYSSLTPTE